MFRISARAMVTGAAVVFAMFAGVADAQQRWEWPEKAENLDVLPKDTSAQQLRSIMFGFTRSLGVRCSHCHVGEPDSSISTYDFPSDKNPNKERAREMLRMLKDINEHLQKIDPSEPVRVNMWCGTCHRGRPRPTTLEEELRMAYGDGDAAAATARYHELREKYYGMGALDFGERPLNGFGYELLRKPDLEGALAIFRLNADAFPLSGNVWDSLAEAYLMSGRPEMAEIYYRKSLELNPDNRNALEQLNKLKAGGETDEGGDGS